MEVCVDRINSAKKGKTRCVSKLLSQNAQYCTLFMFIPAVSSSEKNIFFCVTSDVDWQCLTGETVEQPQKNY